MRCFRFLGHTRILLLFAFLALAGLAAGLGACGGGGEGGDGGGGVPGDDVGSGLPEPPDPPRQVPQTYTVTVRLPLTGQKILRIKDYDPRTTTGIERGEDEAGNAIDPVEAIEAEWRAYLDKHGVMHPSLLNALTGKDERERVRVQAMLNVPGLPEADRDGPDSSVISAVKTRIAEALTQLRSWLSESSAELVESSDLTPFVALEVTVGQARTLARNRMFRRMGLATEIETHSVYDDGPNNGWKRAVRCNYVGGQLGTGIVIGNAEWGNLTTNLSGEVSTWFDPPVLQFPAAVLGSKPRHLTQTSEVLASDATPFGVAPRCQLVIGNSNTVEDGMAWCARSQLADVVNSSTGLKVPTGDQGIRDVAMDWIASRFPWPVLTLSAGNEGGVVGNTAVNALIVGATDYRATDDRSDDEMTSFSAWMNPNSAHGDRESPQICAPGRDVDTALFDNLTGTSFSAPTVAGVAALVMQAAGGRLKYWPEATRALLLAAADQDVEGGGVYAGFHGMGDQKDGVGELNARSAVSNANVSTELQSGGLVVNGPYGFAKGVAGVSRGAIQYRIRSPFDGYKRVRVVLAWTHLVDCDDDWDNEDFDGLRSCIGDDLSHDLDLWVFDGNGQRLLASQSYDNPFEVVDFYMAPHATYTIMIYPWSGRGTTWYGLAVDNH